MIRTDFKIISLMLFLFIGLNVFSMKAQDSLEENQGKLSFFITDSENGYGVPSRVKLIGPKEINRLKTNEAGRVEFSGQSEKYEIEISAEGYEPLTTYFTIETGEKLDIKVILEKTDRSSPQYKKRTSPKVQGYVVDETTGKPLEETTVELVDENISVTTDKKGFFSLNPKNFSKINSASDEVIRSDFKFSKPGFSSHTEKDIVMVPDLIKMKVFLKKGAANRSKKYHQNILDGTKEDAEGYKKTQVEEPDSTSNVNAPLSTCDTPSSIRVGVNCNCTSCSSVEVMSLQHYSETGLDDEWIPSWHQNSLKAGSIPYRTYGGYYVNHPVNTNYDIASSTCNQVWDSTVYNNTESAAASTAGITLTLNGSTPVRSEYSAENNHGGTSYNCANGYAGGSGDFNCYSDNICSGKTPAGHGRGMCQWGSQRWAEDGKSYMWIINHYYLDQVNYTICEENPPPNNLTVGQSPDCNNNATLEWDNSAGDWTIQISTYSGFSNYSSKSVSSGTSTSAPSGFIPEINWQPNTTYYWRIKYDDETIDGPSFTYDQCDYTPPTTDVSVDGDWHTEDFEAVFNDEDEEGGSGVEKGFYHVLYLDEGTWKANAANGFLSDNFEGSAPDSKWTSETGTWEVDDNVLKQTDETENNSNLHADLTQDLSNRYLYTWQGKITGSGDNRRAGIHFFSDNPTQSNRGNSYFVYFRVDDDEIQIHKVNDNDFVLEESVPHTIVADQWYNFKVSFDRITGEMVVIIDGEIVATWTDSDPHESGISVSFRSGNAQYEVKHFNVYRSRYPEETISVGNDEDKDVQTQNPDPNTPAAKVKSLAMDGAGNISGIASEFVNIDWSAPEITEINDGPDADIDTTYVNTLEGNWEAEDPHSGIDNYQVAIGTEPGEDDVLEWMDNGSETFISHLFEEIENDQVYYISVKAKNGAGLIASSESDGQRYINEDLGTEKNDLKNITVYPIPARDRLYIQKLKEEVTISIYDMNGKKILENSVNQERKTLDISNLSSANYILLIRAKSRFITKKIIKQ